MGLIGGALGRSGRPGAGRGPTATAGRAAGVATAAGGAVAGFAEIGIFAAGGAARCSGGRSTCTGGRSGVPLPAPITIEGRGPAVGITFSGSGPRGLGGSAGSTASERASGSDAAACSAAASGPLSCERNFALTSSAVSASIELEWVFFSSIPRSTRRSRITFAFTSSSRASSFIRILSLPFNDAIDPPLSTFHFFVLCHGLLHTGAQRCVTTHRLCRPGCGGRTGCCTGTTPGRDLGGIVAFVRSA